MRSFFLLLHIVLASTLYATSNPISVVTDGGIVGRSWLDLNENGLIDPDEPAMQAQVLLARFGQDTLRTTTDADGTYAFSELELNRYTVIFIPEAEVVPTLFRASPNESDRSQVGSFTPPFFANSSVFVREPIDTVNAGWVDIGEICTDRTVQIENFGGCSLSNPSARPRVTAIVTPADPAYTYQWSDGQTADTVSFVARGRYSVTVTDPSGCKLVQRFFYPQTTPQVVVELEDLLFPCGEDTLFYQLPDSIVMGDFTLTQSNFEFFGDSIDALLAGESVGVTQIGQLSFRFESEDRNCRIALRQSVSKPVATSELSLEISGIPDRCQNTYYLIVRGPSFDGLETTPAGHTVQFFDPQGEPLDLPPESFITQSVPPGTYTALVTSVCSEPRFLTLTTPEAASCGSLGGRLLLNQAGDCSANEAIGMSEVVITFTNADDPNMVFHGFAYNEGQWAIELPVGRYTVEPQVNPQLAATFCTPDTLVVTEEFRSDIDLVYAQQAECPVLETDVALFRLRRNFRSSGNVYYWNRGTATAENAVITVDMDPFFTDIESDLPFTQDGNTLTFAVGDIPPLNSGRIWLYFTVTGAELGQNHCVSSQITPAELCSDPPGWAGGMLRVDYTSCTEEAVTFTITNAGTAPTTIDATYHVLRDGVLEIPTISLGVLAAGEQQAVTLPATGVTYQIFTNQEPNAPASAEPSVIAEGCGRDAMGSFSMGFGDLFPVGNGFPGTAIDCAANIGSFDPNEKLGSPIGVGEDRQIEPGTRLTYDIYFQNTGTDTAFTVLILDTLPEALDLATLRLGASSHNYVADLDSNRVLSFRFDNILLPDSTTNLVESQGVVQFTIDHDTTLVRGDRFANNAAIYFDFNAPIITDFARHRLALEPLVNPAAISAAVVEARNASCGLDNGIITVFAESGAAPFTYSWSHDSALNGPMATNLPAGTYTLTITGANGASVTLEQELTASSALMEATPALVQDAVCGDSNGLVALDIIGGVGGLTYNWSQDTALNGPVADLLAAGTYGVTVTDGTDCAYQSSFTVEQVPEPQLRLIAQDTVCPGALGNAVFLALNFNGETDLGFDLPGVTVFQEQLGPDSLLLMVSNLPVGNYSVELNDENGCLATALLDIVESPMISAEAVVTPSSCTAGSSGVVQVIVSGGVPPYSYNWPALDGATDSVASGLSAGVYAVEISDINGCTITLMPEVTEQGNDISIVVTDSTLVTCTGIADGSFTVEATGTPTGFTYIWSNGQSGPTANGLVGGEAYSVVVTNADGCSRQLSVELPGGDLETLDGLEKTATVCAGEAFLLDLSQYSNQHVTGPDGFTDTNAVVSVTQAGLYNIQVTTTEGCLAAADFTLTVSDSSFFADFASVTDAVIDLPFVVVEQSMPVPDRVNWQVPSGVMVTGGEDRSYTLDFPEPGDYRIGLIASLGGCTDSTFTDITIHADSSTITNLPFWEPAALDLVVMPNPSGGSFTVSAELFDVESATMTLYNSMGQLLEQRKLPVASRVQERFALSLPAGVYFLSLSTEKNRTVTTLVIH